MRVALSLSILVLLASCASPRSSLPRIAEIYSDAAKRETRNPRHRGPTGSWERASSRPRRVRPFGARSPETRSIPGTEEGARALSLPLTPPESAFDLSYARGVAATGPPRGPDPQRLVRCGVGRGLRQHHPDVGCGRATPTTLPSTPSARLTPRTTSPASRSSTIGGWTTSRTPSGSVVSSRRRGPRSTAPRRQRSGGCVRGGEPEHVQEADELEAWLDRGASASTSSRTRWAGWSRVTTCATASRTCPRMDPLRRSPGRARRRSTV